MTASTTGRGRVFAGAGLAFLGAVAGCGSGGTNPGSSSSSSGPGGAQSSRSTGMGAGGGAGTTSNSTTTSASTGGTGTGGSSTGGAAAGGSSTGGAGTGGLTTGGSGGTGTAMVCVPLSTQPCYNGPPNTAGVGLCTKGLETCDATGSGFGACVGEITPQAESCATMGDDNCDGQINEGCVCTPNAVMPCYSGAMGTIGVGPCVAGTQTCNARGTAFGPCMGEVTPQAESCNTPIDDDCNGQINEGCVCTPNATVSCYSGPAGTAGKGACMAGTQTCNAQGTSFGPCTGEITPQPETCNTPIDDDCNGQVNEGGAGCVCTPNATASCYSGPAGTVGVGACTSGTVTCNAQGTASGPCMGEIKPTTESCNTPVDSDCTGVVNDSCAAFKWSKSPGVGLDDEGFAVTVDPAGNVLVGAYFMGTIDVGCGPVAAPGVGEGALLWKASPSGACIWQKVFGDNTAVRGLATDAAGNVYITSFFTSWVDFGGGMLTSAGGFDAYITKYDTNGVYQWGKAFGDAQGQSSIALAVDAAGNSVTIGYFAGTVDFGGGPLTSAGALDIFVVKLDPNGNHLWSKRFGDGNAQLGNAVAIDGSGNVIITGTLFGTANFGGSTLVSAGLGDVFLAKLASDGSHVWSKRFGDSTDQSGRSVAVAPSGDIVLTGTFAGTIDFGAGPITSLGGSDAFLARFDPAGTAIWSKGLGGPSVQTGVWVALDALGNIGLTGGLDGSADFGGGVLTSAGGTDTYVAKYTSAGTHLWSRRFGGAANQVPRAIAADASGNWYVTGFLTSPMDVYGNSVVGGGGEDLYVLALSP